MLDRDEVCRIDIYKLHENHYVVYFRDSDGATIQTAHRAEMTQEHYTAYRRLHPNLESINDYTSL